MRRLVARLEKGCGAGPGWGSGTSITSNFLEPCDRSSPAIGRLVGLLAEIPLSELEAKSVSDPVESVRVDVDVILQAIHGTAFLVSGLVYDVDTGLIQVVVPPTPLSLA